MSNDFDGTMGCVSPTWGYQACTCSTQTSETTVERIEYGDDDKIVKRTVTKTTTSTPYHCGNHNPYRWYSNSPYAQLGSTTVNYTS